MAWIAYLALVALTIPVRLLWIRSSLWLDESWLANALIAPSWRQMIYYDHWVQSTPVLFLAIERVWIALAGANEITTRVLPWAASLAAAVFFCDVVRRLFAFPLGIVAAALFSVNYWAVKYGEQTKQYGTDLLVSAFFLWLICVACTARLRDRQRWFLAGCAALMCYLSFPAAFWLPSIAIALSSAGKDGAEQHDGMYSMKRQKIQTLLLILLLLIAAAGSNYIFFVRPNHPEIMARDWQVSYHAYLASNPLSNSLLRFGSTLSNLIFPPSGLWKFPLWLALVALLAAGMLRSLALLRRGELRGLIGLLAGIVPLFAGLAASFVREYPVLDYPRLIVWMLPSVYLLLCFAVEPPVNGVLARLRSPRQRRAVLGTVYAGCVMAIVVNSVLIAHRPDSSEKNREMFETVAKLWKPGDCLFVHGGTSEQFALYRRWLSWNPEPVYLGNTDWPCCALEQQSRATNPSTQTLDEDVAAAVNRYHPRTLWLALPSGAAGSWSNRLKPGLDRLAAVLGQLGCRNDEKWQFGQVMLEAAHCR